MTRIVEQYEMAREIDEIACRLLEAAERAGASAADGIVIRDHSVSVSVRDAALEHAERSESIQAGLRVFCGQRQACVSGSDLRDTVLEQMAARAVEMARIAPEDPFAGLADADQIADGTTPDSLTLSDPSPEPTARALEETALEAEASARQVDGVSQVESTTAGYGRTAIFLAASNGFKGGYERTGHSCFCSAISGEGLTMENDYYGETRVFSDDMSAPGEIGRRAGERAAMRAGATRPESGSYPVVFDRRVAGSLIGHLLEAINGMAIVRGSSWLLDAIGENVLPKNLTLQEDPLRARFHSSRPFDGEGLPVRASPVVRNGTLERWILDLATARRLGLQSTANAVRGVGTPPSPGVSNLELTLGDTDREGLLREMGGGLLITSLIGRTINPTTGDYSRGAGGHWVKGGEIGSPLNEFTLAGNLKEILASIRPANDPRPFARMGVPSLLAEGLTVAGT